jgi:hypothetical protein
MHKRATDLDSHKEAAWWNLGIAASALRDWPEARRAWMAYGIDLADGPGEVSMPPITGCVRLNPKDAGEVVWGDRIDPARMVIVNIPLPESRHRFHDIVLNDGAPEGTRLRNGVEVDVFNELEIWQASQYSTFEAKVDIPTDSSEARLVEVCRKYKLGAEDWSTVRILCAKCSQGNPGSHECEATTPHGVRRSYAFRCEERG